MSESMTTEEVGVQPQEIVAAAETAVEGIEVGATAESREAALDRIEAEIQAATAEIQQLQDMTLAESEGNYTSPGVADAVQRAREEYDAAQAELAVAAKKAKAKINAVTAKGAQPKPVVTIKTEIKNGSIFEETVSVSGSKGPDIGAKVVDKAIEAIHDPGKAAADSAIWLIDKISGSGGKDGS